MTPKKRRVLILDREPRSLEQLTGFLKAPHLELVSCTEVEAAESLIDQGSFDMLVLDLEASSVGALPRIRLIRRVTCRSPRTGVIALTADLDREGMALGRGLGILEILDRMTGLERLRSLIDAGFPSRDEGVSSGQGEVVRVEALDDVFSQGSISAVLQPIVALEPGIAGPTLFGVEGLARGPEGSLLRRPDILLDYASRKDRLFETEMRCIEAVLLEAGRVPRAGRLFINVRLESLAQPGFAVGLRDLVRSHGHHESDVVLELLELQSALNLRALNSVLRTLHEQGFGLAIDDYGSGFGNLQLVQELPLDFLKIDGLFASNVHQDRRKRAIVRSTVELARELEISTIIEGVETENDLATLYELGVSYAQGHLLSPPRPGADLIESVQAIKRIRLNGQRLSGQRTGESTDAERPGGDAAHELANLVSGIALLADQARNRVSDEDPLHEDLRLILAAGERAVEVTQGMQRGEVPEEPSPMPGEAEDPDGRGPRRWGFARLFSSTGR